MPLYNSERHIETTMLTALNQSFQSIEFLIIDDRGTDESIDIIKRKQQTTIHSNQNARRHTFLIRNDSLARIMCLII